jgi:hypothetical protein
MSTKRPRAKDDHYRRIARKRVDDSRATCSTGKFRYRLRSDAEKVCAVMRAKSPGSTTLGVYTCDECGRLHVGRSRFRS